MYNFFLAKIACFWKAIKNEINGSKRILKEKVTLEEAHVITNNLEIIYACTHGVEFNEMIDNVYKNIK